MRIHYSRSRLMILMPLLLMLGVGLARGQEREPLEENLISVENGGQLVESVGNLPDWPEEDWNGANDGDLDTWAGTVTVFNRPTEGDDHPWAIFSFKDEKVEPIGGIAFFMITRELGNLRSRCGKDFRLEVSTEGTDDGDFEMVLEDTIDMDINVVFEDQEWIEFTFDPVKAKYVKLTFLSNYGEGTYTTLGEFAVYGAIWAVRSPGKSPTTWADIKSH